MLIQVKDFEKAYLNENICSFCISDSTTSSSYCQRQKRGSKFTTSNQEAFHCEDLKRQSKNGLSVTMKSKRKPHVAGFRFTKESKPPQKVSVVSIAHMAQLYQVQIFQRILFTSTLRYYQTNFYSWNTLTVDPG